MRSSFFFVLTGDGRLHLAGPGLPSQCSGARRSEGVPAEEEHGVCVRQEMATVVRTGNRTGQNGGQTKEEVRIIL